MLGQSAGRLALAVGPEAQPPAGDVGVADADEVLDESVPEAAAACRWRDHELGTRALDEIGDVEMRVADEAPLRGPGEQVAYVGIAAVAKVQHHVLGDRGHPVMPRGVIDEVEDIEDLRAVEVATDLDRAHLPARLSISASSSSVDTVASSGRAGTKRYPTLRTVPMSASCSGPSLARRRRTWTSTVRVPPK